MFNFFKKEAPMDYSGLEFKPNQKVYLRCYPYVNGDYHLHNAIIKKFAYKKYADWIYRKEVNWYEVITDVGKSFILPCGVIEDLQQSIDGYKALCKLWEDSGVNAGDKGFPINYKQMATSDIKNRESFLNN